MLIIIFNRVDRYNSESFEQEWKVDEKLLPHMQNLNMYDFAASKVIADGEELQYLYQHFDNLPFAYQPGEDPLCPDFVSQQIWRGDMAAFIVDHLPRSPAGVKIRAEG